MKQFIKLLLSVLLAIICIPSAVSAREDTKDLLKLTSEEAKWLEDNKERSFTVGLTPQSGFDYFKYNEEEKGYIEPLLSKISEDLGIKINLRVSENWNEIYTALQEGDIDIIYGANETPERAQFMAFTKPVLEMPYAIVSRKEGPVHTIGDLDNRRVGFLKGDYVIETLPKIYKNIYYHRRLYLSEDDGINALVNGLIDAYITTGGPDVYEYIFKYPELAYTFKINSITSDETFSTRKSDNTLVEILNKEIIDLEKDFIPEIINRSQIEYNFKIMNLTEKERKWLKDDGTAVVGVTKDYLPFDYYKDGEYKGVDANILKEISKMTGIKLKYYYSDFDDLENKLKFQDINILNIAKTDARLSYVIYPQPFSRERDIIVGRKDKREVKDIFGLEGKTVAVVRGFWHKDMLLKNLTNVDIIETNSIEKSMRLVIEGKADYLIENPTVVKYYTEELQYFDLVQRGDTSTDSFLYFGVSKDKPELASIINKVLPIMDIEDLSRKGYEEVPHKDNRRSYQRLVSVAAALVFALILICIYVIKLVKDLINMKTEQELLKQREYLLSIDMLTELHNRNYLSTKAMESLNDLAFPQVLIAADMNDLKIINDTYGHAAGDMLLKEFSGALKEGCPENSQLFRIGGDEFIVIITGSSEEEALATVENIKEAARGRKIFFSRHKDFTLTAALGYSIRYSKEVSFDELSKIADISMYENKRIYKKQKKGCNLRKVNK